MLKHIPLVNRLTRTQDVVQRRAQGQERATVKEQLFAKLKKNIRKQKRLARLKKKQKPQERQKGEEEEEKKEKGRR